MSESAPERPVKLCKPTLGSGEEEAVLSVLRSGHLVSGKWVAEFESKLSKELDGKKVLTVANGTAALHVALIAAGVKEGDEVLVPALTYPAPVNIVELLGATPVLVDISPETACIDVDLLESKLTDKTRAIVPVHQFGIPADMKGIQRFADRHDLIVVEDAACALGSVSNAGRCGTIGALGCFSFHPRKIITSGEGGAICVGDEALYSAVDRLRNHGQDVRLSPSERFVSSGYNLRLSDLHGGLGSIQMDQLQDFIASRKRLADRYKSKIERVSDLEVLSGLYGEGSVVQSLVVKVSDSVNRNEAIERIRGKGVETTIASYGIHRLPVWRDKEVASDYPVADAWHERGMTLPLFPEMEVEEVDRVIDVLVDVFGGA